MVKAAAAQRMARRGPRGRRDAPRHPPRRRRRHHHLLRARRGAAGARMRRRARWSPSLLAALLVVPPGALARQGNARTRARPALPPGGALAASAGGRSGARRIRRASSAGKLVEALGPQEFDYHFFVVESPMLNAFAVPGGYVFVFTGLIAPRQHRGRDRRRPRPRDRARQRAPHRAPAAGRARSGPRRRCSGCCSRPSIPCSRRERIAAAQTAQLKYSRDFEQEADYLGLRTTTDAGYDPQALTAFFKQLLIEQRVNPDRCARLHAVAPDHRGSRRERRERHQVARPEDAAGPSAASPEFLEAKAVATALDGPPDVVIAQLPAAGRGAAGRRRGASSCSVGSTR